MSKNFFFFTFCITLFLGSIFFFFSVKSANTDIVINEIGAYESSGYEWVEVFNRGEEDVDLSGWKFWEGGINHGLSLKQGDVILPAGEFALIVQDDIKFLELYRDVTSTIFDSAWGSLNENGEEVGLKDSENNFIEKFIYAVAETFSLERIDPSVQDYTESNWVEHLEANTVGMKNSVAFEENVVEGNEELIVENIPPTASFVVSSSSVATQTEIIFDASDAFDTDGNIESWEWNFGDGTSGVGQQVSHFYATTGTFNAELFVRDEGDAVQSTTTVIHVFSLEEEDHEKSDLGQSGDSNSDDGEINILPLDTIVMNEFVSDPLAGSEWIELYNFGTTTVDLDGFTLSDGVGVVFTITSNTLDAKNFFVVELSSSKLNNTGDTITLKNSEGKVIDHVAYGDFADGNFLDNAKAAQKGNSVVRRVDGVDTDNGREDFVETTTITKGLPNQISEPVAVEASPQPVSQRKNRSTSKQISASQNTVYTTGDIVINELVSDPADEEKEFIEFLNKTSRGINLTGWYIEDGAKNKTVLEGNILSHGFFVLENPKGSLNNSGDAVSLFDPSGKQIDTVTYGVWNDENILDNAPAASDPFGLSRRPGGIDTGNDYVDFFSVGVSKNAINSAEGTSTQSDAIKKVFINEIFPNPTGDDSKIEI